MVKMPIVGESPSAHVRSRSDRKTEKSASGHGDLKPW